MVAPPGRGHPAAGHWYKLVIPDRRSLEVYCKVILHDGVVTPAYRQADAYHEILSHYPPPSPPRSINKAGPGDGGGLRWGWTRCAPPHPRPLPCLRRSGFAQAGTRGEGDNGGISDATDPSGPAS